jgi:iron complex outermembrane receptor protein
MKLKKSMLSTTAILAAALCAPTSSYAQDGGATRVALEEIVVTARKRDENLMDVPLAISAFTAKDIEAANLKDVVDVAKFTPGFFFKNQVGGGSGRNDRSSNALIFRGLSVSGNGGITAAGLLFVDGAPVIGATAPGLADVERVEVLKGPQSAYFGRSTFAGAINFITRDPGEEFKGRFSAEASSFKSSDISASLEGPLVGEVLSARISARNYVEGGQYRNFSDRNEVFGDRSTEAVSGTIVFRPTDNLKIKAFVNYLEDEDGPPAQGSLKDTESNCNLGGTLGRYYCGTVPDKFPLNLISGNYVLNSFSYPRIVENSNRNFQVIDSRFLDHGGLRRRTVQGDVKVDYETPSGYSFGGITAYHKDKMLTILDLNFRDGRHIPNPTAFLPGAPPFSWWMLTVQSKFHDYSQEVRVASPTDGAFRWVAGGNYLKAVNHGGVVNGFSVFGNLAASGVTRSQASTPAVFGGVYYDVMPQLTLSAEARYQWDKVKQQALTSGAGVSLGTTGPQFSNTFRSFSPRVTIDYKLVENSTLYALWSRGYRPGGFNTIIATLPAAVVTQFFAPLGVGLSYKEEKLDNYEVGFKSTFMDGRAAIRSAFYKDYYRRGQIAANVLYSIPPNPTVLLAAPIQNIGAVNLKGIELEGDLQATEQFKVSATFSLNDSNIRTFVCSDCLQIKGTTNATGNQLAQTPKYKWTGTVEYSDNLVGELDWFSRLDYTHRGSYFAENANVAKNTPADIINFRIGLRNDAFSLETFVTNLTNDRSPDISQSSDLFKNGAGLEVRYGLPNKRKVGVRGSYNF